MGPRTNRLTLLECAVLVHNLIEATQHPEVGFEDLEHSYKRLRGRLASKTTDVPREILESYLWSANLLNEVGLFWHPDGVPFKDFVGRILNEDEEFDYFYNYIKERKNSDAV